MNGKHTTAKEWAASLIEALSTSTKENSAAIVEQAMQAVMDAPRVGLSDEQRDELRREMRAWWGQPTGRDEILLRIDMLIEDGITRGVSLESLQREQSGVYIRVRCPDCEGYVNIALPSHIALAWKRDAERQRIVAAMLKQEAPKWLADDAVVQARAAYSQAHNEWLGVHEQPLPVAEAYFALLESVAVSALAHQHDAPEA